MIDFGIWFVIIDIVIVFDYIDIIIGINMTAMNFLITGDVLCSILSVSILIDLDYYKFYGTRTIKIKNIN